MTAKVWKHCFELPLLREAARAPRAARIIVVRETQTLIERGTRWLLQRSPEPFEITDLVARFLPAVEALGAILPGLLASAPASNGGMDAAWFRHEGVGEGLAARLTGLSERRARVRANSFAEVGAVE